MNERVLGYLRLVRAPAIFSALGDPLAGMLIASASLPLPGAAVMAAASGASYWAGMALNDLADRELDARERPGRPIPSGAVGVRHAAVLGFGLLGVGLALAVTAGATRMGLALAVAILGYNFALKAGPMGPLVMGACRALSMLTGAEAVGGAAGIAVAAPGAVVLGAYVAGLTLLARGETGESGNHTALPGVLTGAAAVGATVVLGGWRALPWAVAVAALAGGAAWRAVKRPAPQTVGPAVGASIRAIPALDAALAAPAAPVPAAGLAVGLLALGWWGKRKRIAIS